MRRKRATNVWGDTQSHWQVTQSHPSPHLEPWAVTTEKPKFRLLFTSLQPAHSLLSLATKTKSPHAWAGTSNTGWEANTELDFGCFPKTGLRRPQDTTQLWSILPHFSSNHCFRAGGMNLVPQERKSCKLWMSWKLSQTAAEKHSVC